MNTIADRWSREPQLTDQDLDDLEKLCRDATPGPWDVATSGRMHAGGEIIGLIERLEDRPLMRVVRTLLPRLTRELRVLRSVARVAVEANTDTEIARALDGLRATLPATSSAERTPDLVLRAMLRAYEAALLDAVIAAIHAVPHSEEHETAHDRQVDLREAVSQLRLSIATWLEFRTPSLPVAGGLRGDYEARLSGERPLNAPPPAVP